MLLKRYFLRLAFRRHQRRNAWNLYRYAMASTDDERTAIVEGL